MTEPAPVTQYAVAVAETAKRVACSACGAEIGHVVKRDSGQRLEVGNISMPYLPGDTKCLTCGAVLYFGEPHRQRAKRPAQVWDGKKFVDVEGK